MVKPNWDNFKAKFSENPQNNFEWLCYLLFCKEFNQELGIFRYKNQSRIETNPIIIDNDVIGWQAKFYESSLSRHSDELLKIVEKVRDDYPNITKLYIYSNEEWGQGRKKGSKPKGLKAIEKLATEKKISIVWKTASFFESEFVTTSNAVIVKHFFTFDRSIVTLMNELKEHTECILNLIQSEFCLNDKKFEINRDAYVEELNNEEKPVSILSGSGGVGKTVIVKKLYRRLRNNIPFYVFKATEFELSNIDKIFTEFSFYEFTEGLREQKDKIIVIDSAEKLLNLNNTDPFKEFLSILLKDRWRIIFTTRNNYLEDLNYQFFEIYKIAPTNITIQKLELGELFEIAEVYDFLIPNDEKLIELIRIPFYLNEYISLYDDDSKELKYVEFKNRIWKKSIKKSQPNREVCFLQIALERANSGQFFLNPDCNTNTLADFTKDGVLGYEEAGYFISHDIYEEWALERIIEREFKIKDSDLTFFNRIGHSLPMRRSFRNWLSEGLLLNRNDIRIFIDELIKNQEVEAFWKDETFVSILLSDHSETFFDNFQDELLEDGCLLLKKITFILRIACKEVDNNFYAQIGLKYFNQLTLKHILTKPKGQGWESTIEFAYVNLESIGFGQISFLIPILVEWNRKIGKGKTTRLAGLIALRFYQWIMGNDVLYYYKDRVKELISIILLGSVELKSELEPIFQSIIENKWKSYGDPYYGFSLTILTEMIGYTITKAMPECVMKLAYLFWSKDVQEDDSLYHSAMESEHHFGIEKVGNGYSPASAFQTPVYWLLNTRLKETLDFILEFTNKSIEEYASSGYDHSVYQVDVHIDDSIKIEQYSSHCLWNMYRGSGSPVCPYLLQSIHMALEKYFLNTGKIKDSQELESWLIYLLKNSKSASITSVITSVVLAFPEKTFNVAKILFRTRDFIREDTLRIVFESDAKSLYSFSKELGFKNTEVYDDERIKTCEDKHRQFCLEHIFLQYQWFKSEEISDEEVKERQEELWRILDEYYSELSSESEQTDDDRTWRLFLARMDRRGMKVETEETDNGIAIQFIPNVTPDIKEQSDKAVTKHNEQTKYFSLLMWSKQRYDYNEQYKQYKKYEEEPKLALFEAKEIYEKIATNNETIMNSGDEDFLLFHHSIPAYVCSVLLREFLDLLTDEDKALCSEILMSKAVSALNPKYSYQMSDGVQAAISALPILFKIVPEEKGSIKFVLLMCLFFNHTIDQINKFSIFSIMAIKEMWKDNALDAYSIFLGYIYLRPKYEDLSEGYRSERNHMINFRFNDRAPAKEFIENHEEEINAIIDNTITLRSLEDLRSLDVIMLEILFKMIPTKIDESELKEITLYVVKTIFHNLLDNGDDDKVKSIKYSFLRFYANFILNIPETEIVDYLAPVLSSFRLSELFADLLKDIVLAEDRLNTYDNFWFIWETVQPQLIELSNNSDNSWYRDSIIKSYLFANIPWKETAQDWRSFKDENANFFAEISEEIGHCPSVLYAISKLLNDIGSPYLDKGVFWINTILRNNPGYSDKKLEVNTIYYIENAMRKYVFKHKEEIKKKKILRNKLILIMNFLVSQNSEIGYMLRESII